MFVCSFLAPNSTVFISLEIFFSRVLHKSEFTVFDSTLNSVVLCRRGNSWSQVVVMET